MTGMARPGDGVSVAFAVRPAGVLAARPPRWLRHCGDAVAQTAKAQAVPVAAMGLGRAAHVMDGTLRARNRSQPPPLHAL